MCGLGAEGGENTWMAYIHEDTEQTQWASHFRPSKGALIGHKLRSTFHRGNKNTIRHGSQMHFIPKHFSCLYPPNASRGALGTRLIEYLLKASLNS